MAFITPANLEHFQPVDIKNAIVTAEALTKRFGNQDAIQDVSFEVPQGAIFGFIGPSGSGKTTTVRILTGFYRPTSGKAIVLGRDPSHFSQRRRAEIGYMPQLFVLYPHLTVWENLSFAASIYGMGLINRHKKLRDVLEFVELYEHRHKLVSEISGGMQRRLSLAATLVHDPELLFLDEPTGGIDPVLRRKFWDHFKLLQKQGRTLFVTTQYVNEAAYCDLVGVMAEGRLLTVDTPEGLRRQAYKGEIVEMHTYQPISFEMENELISQPYVVGSVIRVAPNYVRIVVNEAATAMPDLFNWARTHNLNVEAMEEYLPPFDDVFVELVKTKEERPEDRTNG